MTTLVALSVSIGILGAVATWLALGPLASVLLIWAVFIAWATFFAVGGDTAALKKTITCNVFGVIMAWIAALIIVGVPVDALGAAWPAIVVGLTVMAMCLAAHVPMLSTIPATVFGYAATFAYLLHTDGLAMAALTSASFQNALIIVAVSMIVGAFFGIASARLGAALTKKPKRAPVTA